MDILARWFRRRAAKRMAVPLLKELSTSYGGSEFYTVAQINVAFRKLRLDILYIDLAFAKFLDFEDYSKSTGNSRSKYESAKLLYARYLPDGDETAWAPAPVNEYVKQLTGLS